MSQISHKKVNTLMRRPAGNIGLLPWHDGLGGLPGQFKSAQPISLISYLNFWPRQQAVVVGCKAIEPSNETMLTEFIKSFHSPVLAMIICLFTFSDIKGQTDSTGKKYDIKKFNTTIVNSDYAMAYSMQTSLTEKQITIIYKSGLEGGKDTILFSKTLQPSDTLQQISDINISSLKKYYSNPCIEDGLQVTVIVNKDNQTKSVHLSNYYQEDVGKIIYLVNSLVAEKYRVWYNKERLIADYKQCQGIK